MDLKTSGFRMKGLLKLTDGRRFRGCVQVNSVLRTQNDIADYLLQVNEQCLAQPGMAVHFETRKFLLGRGTSEFLHDPLFRTMRMIEATDEFAWSRGSASTDSISGLAKSTTQTSLGTALVSMLATSKVSDAFHTTNSKFAFVTNSAVQVDDRLGPYIVTFVDTKHGLQYGEAR